MPTSTIPPYFYRPDALRAAQPTVSKHLWQLDTAPTKGVVTHCSHWHTAIVRGCHVPFFLNRVLDGPGGLSARRNYVSNRAGLGRKFNGPGHLYCMFQDIFATVFVFQLIFYAQQRHDVCKYSQSMHVHIICLIVQTAIYEI